MKTVHDERQIWLNGLKVGDEVFVTSRYHKQICKVTKITPTRRMEVDKFPSSKFDSCGRQMSADSFGALNLYQPTPKIKEELMRVETSVYLKSFNWSDLSTQQLLDVIKIIGGEVHGN